MNYDFSQLSDKDFEELTLDLMSAKTSNPYVNFPSGKDQGIDLKYQDDIVQCKHYKKSGVDGLISSLKLELVKIKKITPLNRYTLVTSVGLTLNNKNKIKDILNPFIKDIEDILGQDDLNALLRNHPKIEQTHYKLWFPSTAILEKILYPELFARTNVLISEILKTSQVYVSNDSFNKGKKLLENNRFLIISGEAGIGKTTLSHMLLSYYIKEKSAIPVVISTPKEAFRYLEKSENFILLYDDFLGMTQLKNNHDALYHNNSQEEDLIRLIQKIQDSKSVMLVLTSREYVLNQAIEANERFANSNVLKSKYILKLSTYTRLCKAEILYKHLYHSLIDKECISQLLDNKAYEKIIDHINYFPRIIEWMTNKDFLNINKVQPNDYMNYFLGNLDNPKELLKNPYCNQISDASRNLLNVLFSTGCSTNQNDLKAAFDKYHKFCCTIYNYKSSIDDFNNALQELLNSFLKIEKDVISFHNPAVEDFMKHYISDSSRIEEMCSHLFNTAVYQQQIFQIWKLIELKGKKEESLLSNRVIIDALFISINNYYNLPQCSHITLGKKDWLELFINIYLYTSDKRALEFILNIIKIMDSTNIYLFDWSVLINFIDHHDTIHIKDNILLNVLTSMTDLVEKHIDNLSFNDFYLLYPLMNLKTFSSRTKEKYKNSFIRYINRDDVDNELISGRDISELEYTLSELIELGEHLEISIPHYFTNRIEEGIDELRMEQAERMDYDYGCYKDSGKHSEDKNENYQIEHMFSNLSTTERK